MAPAPPVSSGGGGVACVGVKGLHQRGGEGGGGGSQAQACVAKRALEVLIRPAVLSRARVPRMHATATAAATATREGGPASSTPHGSEVT